MEFKAPEVDNIEGILVHLENHDVTYVAVARAPIEEIEVIRKRMGWRFRWVSSYNTDLNYDFNVSFRPEEVAAHRAYYNYSYTDSGVEDLPAIAYFLRTIQVRYIPIRRTAVAWKSLWELIGFSTRLRMAETRMDPVDTSVTGYGSGPCTVRASRLGWLFSTWSTVV